MLAIALGTAIICAAASSLRARGAAFQVERNGSDDHQNVIGESAIGRLERAMTLDGLLGAIALGAALFALVPGVQRLRASLALSLQMSVAAVAMLLILWLEIYEPALPCAFSWFALCNVLTVPGDHGTVARKDAFLVVLGWGAAAVALHRFSRVRIGSVPAMGKLAARLIDENRFGEALSLLAPHVDLFVDAGRRQGRWQLLHDWFASFGKPVSFPLVADEKPAPGDGWPSWACKCVRFVARVIPAQRNAEAAALDTLQLVHRSPQIVTYLAEQRPDLAPPYLRARTYSRGEFSDAFLEHLAARPGSVLYHEIERNQNLIHPIGYALPEGNRLLNALFSDSNFAVEIAAWKPVGDYLERLLDGAERRDHVAWLNGSAKWYEREWWRDPAFVALFYFDIMVSSAISQGVRNHMWLHYFPHFADRIARAYASDGADVDRNAEFPTRSARLLYEIVSYLTKWIEVFPDLPDGSPHKTIPANRNQIGTNIPFSAATALGRAFASIARSGRVDIGVIEALHDKIARTIRGLPRDGPNAELRQRVVAELVSGGGGTLPHDYLDTLSVLLMNTDHIVRYDIEDYGAAIDAARPG